MDLALRPIQIPMSRGGRSTTSIHADVTNIKLGYGRPNKKKKLNDEGLFGGENLPVESSGLGGMKLVQQTQKIEKNRT